MEIKHLEQLLSLLNVLANHNVHLFELNYHPSSFGSFVLNLGRSKKRLQFIWDGKENRLTANRSKFMMNQNSNPRWQECADQIVDQSPIEQVLIIIKDLCKQEFEFSYE